MTVLFSSDISINKIHSEKAETLSAKQMMSSNCSNYLLTV